MDTKKKSGLRNSLEYKFPFLNKIAFKEKPLTIFFLVGISPIFFTREFLKNTFNANYTKRAGKLQK